MKRTKAQSLSEYAIGLLVVILALMAMQVYVKRGLQGRYVDLVSQTTLRINKDSGGISQYEPYYVTKDITTEQSADTQERIRLGGRRVRNIIQDTATSSGMSAEGINCYDDK